MTLDESTDELMKAKYENGELTYHQYQEYLCKNALINKNNLIDPDIEKNVESGSVISLTNGINSPAKMPEDSETMQDKEKLSEFWYKEGLKKFKQKDYTTALEDYKKSLSLDENNYRASNDIGACYMRRGEYDAAIPYLNKVLEINTLPYSDPSYAASYRNKKRCFLNISKLNWKKERLLTYRQKMNFFQWATLGGLLVSTPLPGSKLGGVGAPFIFLPIIYTIFGTRNDSGFITIDIIIFGSILIILGYFQYSYNYNKELNNTSPPPP